LKLNLLEYLRNVGYNSNHTEAEKILLTKADRQLIEHVNVFYQELSRFVNLAEIRKTEAILPQRVVP
jgi:hypothetical protein